MSDYSPTEDFSVKDGLTTGDPEKVISGADIDGEFDAIATMSQSKIDEPATPATGDLLAYSGGWVAWDIEDFTDEAAPAGGDKILVYDLTASAHRAMTITSIVALAPASFPAPGFTSSEQTVTADTQLDVAHSLGGVPELVQVVLRCKTTDLGYGVGDEVLAQGVQETSVSNRGFTVFADATNVSIVTGDSITLISATSKNVSLITLANWRWVIKAWTS